MAWHDETVPGKGWVELRATIARFRPETAFLVIRADVLVDAQSTFWDEYEGGNPVALQKAIMGRLKTARITRAAIQRRDRLLRRMTTFSPGREGWLDFWSTVLDVPVLELYRWEVQKSKTQ